MKNRNKKFCVRDGNAFIHQHYHDIGHNGVRRDKKEEPQGCIAGKEGESTRFVVNYSMRLFVYFFIVFLFEWNGIQINIERGHKRITSTIHARRVLYCNLHTFHYQSKDLRRKLEHQ